MVVFIIGIVSGFIVMTLPERASNLRQDTVSLQRDVDALVDRAVLTGVPHGIAFARREYQGVRWQGGEWVEIGAFTRKLSPDVFVRLGDLERGDDRSHMTFDPTGVPTRGVIELSSRGRRAVVSVNRYDVEQKR